MTKASTADVVLFLASTMEKSTPTIPVHANRGKALYALMSMEQPKYAPVLTRSVYLKEHFDLLLTYSLQPQYGDTGLPNLPMTYYPLNIVAMEAVMQPPRPFADKVGISGGTGDATLNSVITWL